jgi:hypothetical protein
VATKRNLGLGAICGILAAVLTISAQANEMKCEGPFAKDTDHKRLVSSFGQSNVARETVYVEGDGFPASIVFPKQPNRRLEILWWNEKARRRPATIQADGAGWIGPKGIRVGMTLGEVEALNGRPFTLLGFGWDFGGRISEWKGGAFDHLPGDCQLIVFFSEEENVDEAASLKVAGDQEFGSNQNEMKAVKPKVVRIGLGYPQQPQ